MVTYRQHDRPQETYTETKKFSDGYGHPLSNKDLLNMTFYSLLTLVVCFAVLYIINDLTNKEDI